jgi:hypothetical protein
VIVLNNRNDYDFATLPKIVSLLLTDVLESEEPRAEKQQGETEIVNPFEISEKELEIYAGSYYSEDLQTTQIYVVNDGKLELRCPYQKEGVRLEAVSQDQFHGHGGYLELTFEREGDKITELSAKSGRLRPIFFKKR